MLQYPDSHILKLPNDTFTNFRHDTKISQIDYYDVYTKEKVIETYILPKSISRFPSFFSHKQKGVTCPEIFFRRISPADKKRVDYTFEKLLEGISIITIGLPGIGKSTEMNFILMTFLGNIGKKG